jgi:hypothetical protein
METVRYFLCLVKLSLFEDANVQGLLVLLPLHELDIYRAPELAV